MSRILLVDDDDSFRKMLRITLVKMGYKVIEARDGKEAMTMFKQEQPDLVLTDLLMPKQDGLETIHALRQRDPDAKIIAMSAGGGYTADLLKMGQQMGANRVLRKPFPHDELAAMLIELLGKP